MDAWIRRVVPGSEATEVPLLVGTVDVGMLAFELQQSFRHDGRSDLLSTDEKERASRMRFEGDRKRFIKSRSWLRAVLGGYLERDPAKIEFEYSDRGKPSLAKQQNLGQIQFSLGHSGDFAVLAVTSARRVGVDIEQIGHSTDAQKIAQRYFSPREFKGLMFLSEPDRRLGFVAGWTRKEAFLKALGTGLSYPLSGFSVTIDPHKSPSFTELPENLRDGKWWLTDLRAPDGYRAALAVEQGPCIVREREL